MESILKNIEVLFEQELYSNIVTVGNLAVAAADQKPFSVALPVKLQIIYYYGEALYQTKQYAQAENVFKQYIQLRKSTVKNKNASNKISDKIKDLPSETDVLYKVHLCYVALRKNTAAMEILETIPAKQRTPKINMALGNLLSEMGMDQYAMICFKEVLKECPLALEAVENLLRLGVKGVEVNSLIVEVTNEVSWLNSWLKAQAQLYSRDFDNAAQTYKSMDSHGILKDNTTLLVTMGYCYHYMGDDKKAIEILQRARKRDPNLLYGMDLLSTLLAHSDTTTDDYFQTILPKLDISLWSCEHWVIMGNYKFFNKAYDKAAYFGQQAYYFVKKRHNIEALLLKANCFLQLGKYQEAATHCVEALQHCAYRFDVHKCLVESYIKMNRLREADSVALNACKQLNYSPHSLTLHATVLLKDPVASAKTIKKLLEKAISQDTKESSLKAVDMLVVLLEQEGQYEQARQLLLKQIELFSSSRMHQLLGECCFHLQRDEEAFNHYNIALRLDPNNQRAIEGLNSIGPVTSISKRDSYYTCVGESSYTSQATSASDHEIDAESDTEQWPANPEQDRSLEY